MENEERLKAALADRYRIEREIGRGGMATVYLATDIRHEREVALKVLRSDLAASLGAERFLQEVRVTANLTHPHILPLHDSGEADGFLFYVMPYIEGESLRERLSRERELPVAETARILRDVVDALAAAHKLGVVHRDIKPENVLLSGRHALVADFGVAKAVSEATGRHKLTTLGVALGTPSYMAPEQAAADEAIDHRADIYAVGVMAYELLAGGPPFFGNTPQQVLAAQVMEVPKPVSELRTSVPSSLEALVMKCLEKKPADRWQSAEEILPHLEAAATPSGGVTPTDTAPFGRPRRTRRNLVAAVVAFSVIAALGITLWFSRRESEPDLVENRVIVVPFADLTGDTALAGLGTMAANWVTRGLHEVSDVEVVPEATVIPLNEELGASGPATLADRAKANVLVSGSYSLTGGQVQFDIQITEGSSRDLVAALDPVYGTIDNPTSVIDELRERVMSAVGMRFRWNRKRITSGRIPRWEALQESNRSGPAFSERRYGDYKEHNLRAYALDTTYVEFLFWAGVGALNQGLRREADSLLQFVHPRRSELGEDVQFLLDWLHASLRGNALGRYYPMQRSVDRFGPQNISGAQLGSELNRLNRPREAVEVFGRIDMTLPPMRDIDWCWSVYTLALHWIGEHERELAVARLGKELKPTHVMRYFYEARAEVALGRPGRALELLNEAIALAPDNLVPAMNVAEELFLFGYQEAAQEALERALRQAASDDERDPAGRAWLAVLLATAERLDQASAVMQAITIDQETLTPVLGARGIIAALNGESDRASLIAGELLSRADSAMASADELDHPGAAIHYYNAANVLAALGENEEAVRVLTRAIEASGGYRSTVNGAPQLSAWLGDYPPFQELVRPKG